MSASSDPSAPSAMTAVRDRLVIDLHGDGLTQVEVAGRLCISKNTVSRVLLQARGHITRMRSRAFEKQKPRRDRMLRDYNAGFVIAEIAQRHGITRSAACKHLARHPEYVARQGGRRPKDLSGIDVPDWVPEHLRSLYRRLAVRDGHSIAANCLHNRLQLEREGLA